MNKQQLLEAQGEDAMVALGQQLGAAAEHAACGLVVFLQGNLGMGKTTLIRGVIRHFGHQGAVKSPTYTLVEPYEFAEQQVNHFDLYRLGHPEELEFLGIRDYFTSKAINLIEWPDRGAGVLPAADLVISITGEGPQRQLAFAAYTARAQSLLGKLTAQQVTPGANND
ncbi:MAG TPA: tRNA (adenosine(37)-N6)-threonylcarbamoyltransferase complex ATPase subunit type 1 TsaE [Oceanospirillaceae bacterium]|nr:tRNA (adenosine(37)-N6)-threonylcarbamoyltransferase complex ATPase subunit type 1 TsaE [Oceanospirillaceae bacterium]